MGKPIRSNYEMYPHQTVYLQPLNEKSYLYQGLQEAEIILVGQKFITVQFGGWKYKFDLETLEQVVDKEKRGGKNKKQRVYKDWRLFLSKEDYEKNVYYSMLYSYVKQHLGSQKETCKLSLATLEKIRNIIDENIEGE